MRLCHYSLYESRYSPPQIPNFSTLPSPVNRRRHQFTYLINLPTPTGKSLRETPSRLTAKILSHSNSLQQLSHALCTPTRKPAPPRRSIDPRSPASNLVSQSKNDPEAVLSDCHEDSQRTRVAPSCSDFCTCPTDHTRECLDEFKVPTECTYSRHQQTSSTRPGHLTRAPRDRQRSRPALKPTTCPVFANLL